MPEIKDTYTKLTAYLNKQNTLGRAKTFFYKYPNSKAFKQWFIETFFPFIVTNEQLVVNIIFNGEDVTVKIGNIELGYAGAAGIALIIGIITEAFFRFRFLKSLSAVPNFQPKEKPDYFDQLANAGNKQDLMIRSLLYFALGIVLIVFGYLSEFEIFEWIICIAFSLGAIIMGIINLIAVLRKK